MICPTNGVGDWARSPEPSWRRLTVRSGCRGDYQGAWDFRNPHGAITNSWATQDPGDDTMEVQIDGTLGSAVARRLRCSSQGR